MGESRFQYKQSVSFAIFASLFFGGLTFLIGYVAVREGAFYHWILTAIIGIFFALPLFLLVKIINTRQELVLTDKQMKLIKNGVVTEVVDFAKVTGIKYYNFRNVIFLEAIHEDGNFRVTAGMLPSGEDFEFIANYLDERRVASVG